MTETLRILHLEDDPHDAELVRATLEAEGFGVDVVLVDSERGFLGALDQEALDLILADRELPSYNGFEALESAKRRCATVPFIFVSGMLGEDVAIESMKNGATDYVLKDHLAKLGPAVRRALSETYERKERQLAEHKQLLAQAALQASDDRYRRLTARMSALIFELAPDGTTLFVNEAVERVTGYTVLEVLSRNWWELFFPGEWQSQAKILRGRLSSGDVSYFEVWLTSKDGSRIALELNTASLFDEHGRLGKVIGFAIDITQRKLAEAASSGSQRFLRSTIDALNSHIAVLDESGQIVAVNRAWRKVYEDNGGSSISCGVGANYLLTCDGVVGANRAEAQATALGIRRVIDGDIEDFSLEYPCNDPTDLRWFKIHATRFSGEGPVRVVVAHENITERKLAQEETSRLIAGVRCLLWQAHAIDVDGTLHWQMTIHDEESAQAFLGVRFRDGDDIARSFYEIKARDDKERMDAVSEAAIRTGQDGYRQEYRIHTDGGVRWLSEDVKIEPCGAGQWRLFGVCTDVTERKRVEDELKLQAAALQATANAMMITDQFGSIQWVNPAWCLLTGYTADEVLGQNPRILKSGTHGTEFYKDLWSTIASGNVWHGVLVNRRKDGTTYVEEETITPVADESGTTKHYIGVKQDITERKRTEDALRESQQRFESIVSNVPGMVFRFLLRPDGSFEMPFVSEGIQYLSQLDPEALQKDPELLLQLVNAEDRRGLLTSIADSADQMAPWSWEGRYKEPTGQTRWIQGVARPEKMTDGSMMWDGLLMDITARKEAEEERDRFFTLSLDMLAIVGFDGYFKRLNPAFETTLGYTLSELMSKPLIEFVHPSDKAASLNEMDRLASGLETSGFVNRYICRDGSVKWLSWWALPYENLIYAVSHDITAQKDAEAALIRLNEGLEQRVIDRTTELESTILELDIAKQEAERANLAKSEFLSRMSHELRTPLNAILGFGQVLDRPGLQPLQAESVNYILKGGRHLLELINEVLDISRVEAGRLDLSLEPVSLKEVVDESCSLMRPLAVASAVNLEEPLFDSQDIYVVADRQRLKQALINLVANGVKYNRPGGIVAVSCNRIGNGRAQIEVRDTGIGIAPHDLSKLFTPFERLGAMQSDVEGTGLGLALSRALVTAMNGSLEASSTLGKGSVFTIGLPTIAAPPAMFARPPVDPIQQDTSTSTNRGYTVLLIDDNPTNERLIEVYLGQRPKIKTISALLGASGLEMARQDEPDLILLDLNLPDMTGGEVLSRLKRSALTKDIPVLILTADCSAGQTDRLMAAGALSCLAKPIAPDTLLAAVDEVLLTKK